MMQSTNPAPVLVALVRAKGAPKILSRDLRVAFGVYQELARRAQVDLLPRGLTAAAVRAHLQQHLDEELAHGKATKAQASAVRRRRRLEAQARELRIRWPQQPRVAGLWAQGADRADREAGGADGQGGMRLLRVVCCARTMPGMLNQREVCALGRT